MGEKLLAAVGEGWVRAAHDISDGGLAVALPEMAFGGGVGFRASLEATGLPAPGVALVAEGASRWVVEVAPDAAGSFEATMRGLPFERLGEVTDQGGEFAWRSKTVVDLPLEELYQRWRAGLDAVPAR
jgi:phosphoribosylformylglycinamidine synthase